MHGNYNYVLSAVFGWTGRHELVSGSLSLLKYGSFNISSKSFLHI